MVALIDDGDVNRRAGQTMCNLETTEAGADDDDVMAVRCIAQCSGAFDLNWCATREAKLAQRLFIQPDNGTAAVPASQLMINGAHYIFAQESLFILGRFEKHRERISRIAHVCELGIAQDRNIPSAFF